MTYTLADELEDSELRREMYGVKAAVEQTVEAPAAVHEYRMRFTGDGAACCATAASTNAKLTTSRRAF